MPRFLISVIIPALAAWGICGYMVFFTLPRNARWVSLFLITLVVALELSLGIILYSIRARNAPTWLDKRQLLRETALITLLPAAALPLYLALRYATLDRWYIITLLVVSIILSEYQITRKLL